MTTNIKRDLHADLAICEAATAGPWETSGCGSWSVETRISGITGEVYEDADATLIAEAREGWPEAIRRAIEAEGTNDLLRQQFADLSKERDHALAEAAQLSRIIDEECPIGVLDIVTSLRAEREYVTDEIERLRAALERMDDRKNPMLPRSVMSRIAKEALDFGE